MIHLIQHVSFEGPGVIAGWAKSRGVDLTVTKIYAGHGLPDPAQADVLVVLGGPMGGCDEGRYPWLGEEKLYIRQCRDLEKKVVGICLGAQLLADVLGASVSRNDQKEIGWFPVRWSPEARQHVLFDGLPEEQEVLHWHGDTFTLPEGALRLGSSDACVNQGFLHAERALGLQFHLEVTPGGLERLADNCMAKLLEDGPYIQSADEMLGEEKRFREANESIRVLLDKFVLGS